MKDLLLLRIHVRIDATSFWFFRCGDIASKLNHACLCCVKILKEQHIYFS